LIIYADEFYNYNRISIFYVVLYYKIINIFFCNYQNNLKNRQRFFSLAGYIREHKGAPIFASDGQSLMVPTYHLNVPSDFVADKRHGPNLKIIYDEEFSPESSSKSAQPMTSRVRSYTTGEVFVFYEKPEFAKRAVEIFNQQKWSRFLPMMKSEKLHNKAFRISQMNISRAIETCG
jgi:hypothetical protein